MNSTKQGAFFFGQKKWLFDMDQINYMYFTYEETETQTLPKYTVVPTPKLMLRYIKLLLNKT